MDNNIVGPRYDNICITEDTLRHMSMTKQKATRDSMVLGEPRLKLMQSDTAILLL